MGIASTLVLILLVLKVAGLIQITWLMVFSPILVVVCFIMICLGLAAWTGQLKK